MNRVANAQLAARSSAEVISQGALDVPDDCRQRLGMTRWSSTESLLRHAPGHPDSPETDAESTNCQPRRPMRSVHIYIFHLLAFFSVGRRSINRRPRRFQEFCRFDRSTVQAPARRAHAPGHPAGVRRLEQIYYRTLEPTQRPPIGHAGK